MWTIRAAVATGLWVAVGLLTFFFILSGGWLLLPFALAGGGGPVLFLFLIIIGLAAAAHLIGRRASPDRPSCVSSRLATRATLAPRSSGAVGSEYARRGLIRNRGVGGWNRQ